MSPGILEEDDDGFDDSTPSGEMSSSAWDVESEGASAPDRSGAVAHPGASAATAEWGGLWVGLLGVTTVFMLLLAFISMDLVRNLYDLPGRDARLGDRQEHRRAHGELTLTPGRPCRAADSVLVPSHGHMPGLDVLTRMAPREDVSRPGSSPAESGPRKASLPAASRVRRGRFPKGVGTDGRAALDRTGRPARWSAWPPPSLSAGCSFVPTSRLDDCHKLSQTLQTENSRLKDLALKYRSQNRDLTQRAVDDADRLRKQDEAIARLERSVQAYQDEREQMAAALERIKGQIQASADPRRGLLLERVRAFARAHPGCEFDPESGRHVLPDRRGSSSRRPTGSGPRPVGLLKAYAEPWTAPRPATWAWRWPAPPKARPCIARAWNGTSTARGPGT